RWQRRELNVAREPKRENKPEMAESPSRTRHAIDQDMIRALAKLLDETGLTEIEIERDGDRVRVARRAQPATSAAPVRTAATDNDASAPSAGTTLDVSKHPGVVTSPMVGTA